MCTHEFHKFYIGTGSLWSMTFTTTLVLGCRTGTIVLRGPVAAVAVNNQGTGTVFVVGATQRVNVDIGGVGNVVLDNSNGEL